MVLISITIKCSGENRVRLIIFYNSRKYNKKCLSAPENINYNNRLKQLSENASVLMHKERDFKTRETIFIKND